MLKRFTKFTKKRNFLILGLLILISLPTYLRMLRPGIYSMQDFHFFRLVEFDGCISDLQIPCRWAPDAGLGYGEPLFNFYGQTSYLFGETFHLLGFSLISSLKLVFILSLLLSAAGMYFLAKEIWGEKKPAILSSTLYLYAPYRAVDVWVRGALPEAVSFVFYPLILLFFEKFLRTKNQKYLFLFGLFLSVLIVNHNLSFVIFAPFLLLWISYRSVSGNLKLITKLIPLGFLIIGLSAFYVFPVLFESKYVNLDSTTEGYFDFRGHFVGFRQMLFSTNWGYGASLFGPKDDMNLSIGFVQWLLVIGTGLLIVIKRKVGKYKDFVVLFLIGFVYMFLISNRATFLWEKVPFMAYIQFPWRFLGIVVFSFSIAGGVIAKLLPKRISDATLSGIIVVTFLLNFSYFREDIWYKVTDRDLTTGKRWEEQTRASIGDFWPNDGMKIPTFSAPIRTKQLELIEKRSNRLEYKILTDEENLEFPHNNFPGWISEISGDRAIFYFTNTPIRTLGNAVSLFSVGIIGYFLVRSFRTRDDEK